MAVMDLARPGTAGSGPGYLTVFDLAEKQTDERKQAEVPALREKRTCLYPLRLMTTWTGRLSLHSNAQTRHWRIVGEIQTKRTEETAGKMVS